MRSLLPWIALLLAGLACAAPAPRVAVVAEGLAFPWSLAFLPDGSMLVTERAGRLRVIEQGQLRAAPVAGVPAVYAAGQGGLLEVLPHPAFDANRWIYLSYAHGGPGANALRVARARFDGERLLNLEVLLTLAPAKATAVHYGGRLAWLPDGSLLVAGGDGFDYREQAQRLDSHLGKILRIQADGGVPADNPFVDRAEARAEIYSLGHRNVQGLIVDADGAVFAHEHGPRGGDELNRIVAGGNYGWPLATHGVDYSGARVSPFTRHADMLDPLHVWTPSIAPAGLARYAGTAFPAWSGRLLVTALAGQALHVLNLDGGKVVEEARVLSERTERLRDVRVGPDGLVYLLTDSAEGRVLRLAPP